ncbi:MAG: hypothetical protein AAGC78_13115 [Cellvibrio sp.]|uniref:hypothetical protein n=1 Tax=Cellvibrio sp. TaxID=1965322 RepID=UPI0031A3EBD5
MISKLLKLLGKTLAALFVLIIVVVLAFVVINSSDKPPSQTTLEFQQAYDNRKPVNAADNGYIYLAGFDAASDETPEAVGAKRIKFSIDFIKGLESKNKDIFRAEYNPEEAFIKEVKTVFDQCAVINKVCIEEINKNNARIFEWSQAEALIGERYTKLITHSSWLELAPMDMDLPTPTFGLVMKAQRLAFIQELAASGPKNPNRVVELLDKDLQFWRVVLRDTDMLIGKMVAATAIKNNFLWTNQFLLSLDQNERSSVIPSVAQKTFTDEELSLRRSLIGEWIFTSKAYDKPEKMHLDKFPDKLASDLLFKKQDTINRSATTFAKVINEQDISIAEFETTFVAPKESNLQNDSKESSLTYFIKNPYNPVGKILLAVAVPAYDNYSARTKDLEAFRRGLLASIEHMNNVPDASTSYISPYKTKPFVINQQERAITVNGLGNGTHGQLIYSY